MQQLLHVKSIAVMLATSATSLSPLLRLRAIGGILDWLQPATIGPISTGANTGRWSSQEIRQGHLGAFRKVRKNVRLPQP